MTGLFASGPFPCVVYNMYLSILRAEQITRASWDAALTAISFLENESVLDVQTVIIIIRKHRPVSGGLGDGDVESLPGSVYLSRGWGQGLCSFMSNCHAPRSLGLWMTSTWS